MGTIEQRWQTSLSRRKALAGMAGIIAGSPLLHAQLDPRPYPQHRRTPGLNEMFSSFDFEPIMFANVPQAVYDYTAHGDASEWNLRRNRQAFDWVDLVPGTASSPASVDLSSKLLGLDLQQDDGGWGIGHLGPIPEGMVTWLLGLAALVLAIRLIGERTTE